MFVEMWEKRNPFVRCWWNFKLVQPLWTVKNKTTPCAKSLQSSQTLCNAMDCSLTGYRQEYWSVLPCALPGDLPNQGSSHAS